MFKLLVLRLLKMVMAGGLMGISIILLMFYMLILWLRLWRLTCRSGLLAVLWCLRRLLTSLAGV